jgi:hypothetical protein
MSDYESSDPGLILGWVNFFLFFCLAPFTMYQKPVIDHCPWPSSQFNKWHAQNKLLSSSLIVIGSSPCPLTPANHCHRKARLALYFPHASGDGVVFTPMFLDPEQTP